MSLPLETVTYRKVELAALECLIRRHYGLEYSLVRAFGVPSGSYRLVEASAAWEEGVALDPDEAAEIAVWRAGGEDQPHLASVMNDLACSGVIDGGEYLVHVWW